jgi:hypothetical protein
MPNIVGIGGRNVMGPVRIILGTAAAPKIGADYPVPRRQPFGQPGEIFRIAGDAGKAKHWHSRSIFRPTVITEIEFESVLRRKPAIAKFCDG